MSESLPSFQQYQQAFTAYVRNPSLNKPPRGASAKRMKVYAEIVFNNILSSVSGCFPVSQKVLGKRAWQKLVRAFFTDYQSNTPIFREIPEQFLAYVATRTDLPPYLPALAHYEWVELAVSMVNITSHLALDVDGALLNSKPILNPALENLSYHYPVHMISQRHKPTQPLPSPVHLLVYRNPQFEVKFIETNPVTARLISLLQEAQYTGQQALEIIAQELAHPNPAMIIEFGVGVLADLKAQGVILGASLD